MVQNGPLLIKMDQELELEFIWLGPKARQEYSTWSFADLYLKTLTISSLISGWKSNMKMEGFDITLIWLILLLKPESRAADYRTVQQHRGKKGLFFAYKLFSPKGKLEDCLCWQWHSFLKSTSISWSWKSSGRTLLLLFWPLLQKKEEENNLHLRDLSAFSFKESVIKEDTFKCTDFKTVQTAGQPLLLRLGL